MQKIKQLMQLFQVSGKELAEVLFVDQSLVSKWCSGKRRLKAGSAYLQDITAYFLKLDAPNGYIRLRQLLPGGARESQDLLAERLETWLVGDNMSEQDGEIQLLDLCDLAKLCSICSFQDNQGRRDAISYFEEYAATCDGPLEAITYNTENATWFYEDKEFSRKSRRDNLRFVNRGGKLTLIHPLNTTYKNLAYSILNWMPLYLSGGDVRGYYIPKYAEDTILYTYFVIKDRLALMGMSTKKSKKMLTLMLTEKQIVNRIEEILQELIRQASPLMRYISWRDPELHTSFTGLSLHWKGHGRPEPPRLLYAAQLPLLLPSGKWRKMLQTCGLSEKELQGALEDFRMLEQFWQGRETHVLLNVQCLRTYLSAETVRLDLLCGLTGREIRVPAKQYSLLLNGALEAILSNEEMKIGLANPLCGDPELAYSILAQRNTGVLFWGGKATERMALVEEIKTVTAVYEYLEESWNAIPELQKSKEYVAGALRALADEAQQGV